MHVQGLPYCIVIIVTATKLYRTFCSTHYAYLLITHFPLVVMQKKTAFQQNRSAYFRIKSKKFWEELIVYFPLIRHVPRSKRRAQQFLYYPQEALNLLVTGERYWALFYIRCIHVYMFLHSLLNVLVESANKMGLQKRIVCSLLR
jgi:hypothetical protein